MQTTRRPVPSYAALKALRQLAYVASGTACGAAALVYEERRRRIHFVKQVAENGRTIRHAARRTRRGHATAAAAAVADTNDAYALDSDHVWDREHNRRSWSTAVATEPQNYRNSGASRPADDDFLHAVTLRSDGLPSQVNKGYRKWLLHERHQKRSENSIFSLSGRASGKPVRNTSRIQASSREFRGCWFDRNTGIRTRRIRSQSSRVRSYDNILESNEARHSSLYHQQTYSQEVERALSKWSARVAGVDDHVQDLSLSWQALLDSLRKAPSKETLVLIEDSDSIWTLAKAALQSNLPDLLLAICLYTRESGQIAELVPWISNSLATHLQPSMYCDSIDLLLEWIGIVIQKPTHESLSAVDLRWSQIHLLMAANDLDGSSDFLKVSETLLAPARDLESVLSSLFNEALTSEDIADTMRRLHNACGGLVAAGKYEAIGRLFEAFVATPCNNSQLAMDFFRWILPQLQELGQSHLVIDLMHKLQARGLQIDSLILELWRTCESNLDLLDMFEAFQLSPVPDKKTLPRLFNAMMEHHSGDIIMSEMYGPHGRLWTGMLAREWERCMVPATVCNKFWALQNIMGDRQLSPVLYDVVIRKCGSGGMKAEADAVMRFREARVCKSRASAKISVMLRSAQASEWNTVMDKLQELKPEDFGTMQTQQRAQMFDPLIRRYASGDRTTQELYELSVAVFSRVHEFITPTQALRLLSTSLIRTGQVAALRRIYRDSGTLMTRPLLLTPVDAVELFRSFYYSHRPSPVGLAAVIYKTFQSAWQSVSRLCLPLLLVSASYESKKEQQKRNAHTTQNLVKDALLQIDNAELRDALVLEARRLGACDGSSSLDLRKESRPGSNENWSSGWLHRVVDSNLMLEGVEYPDSATIPQLADESAGAVGGGDDIYVRNIPKIEKRKMFSSNNVAKPSEVGESRQAHFMHARSKALLHDAQQNSGGIAALVQGVSAHNVFAPSANMASLMANSHAPESASLRQRLEAAGSDMSLLECREAIQRLQSATVAPEKLCSKEMMGYLKKTISREYERLEIHGQIPNHSLATALAGVMLKHNKPAGAIELLRHALNSHWGTIVKPGIAPMLALLKAYIALGHTDGVRWVVGHVLSHDERIEKSFITALKKGRQVWARADDGGKTRDARAGLVQELERLQKICVEQQAKQIAHTHEVGEQLAALIGSHSAPVEQVAWRGDDDFDEGKGKPGKRDTDRFKDAVLVQSVCGDVLTLAKTKHAPSKAPATLDKGASQLRLVRAMRKVESARAQRGGEVQVLG